MQPPDDASRGGGIKPRPIWKTVFKDAVPLRSNRGIQQFDEDETTRREMTLQYYNARNVNIATGN
ncbi:uncharacterized protein MYCFIDRAFT_169052 [Pseudocercospora fijiensis CIRAD86]|uniref:Uncharacterized protein n=1 Tax=Pseudocercospora fijiensis (strain CIRAD86) TaxID=383855 RepID=N1Q8J9_PSEFD|nr:uncharacterized protein MYCFIDRAFT_169052 [Pseudocercospora fijiensis CIRAD86]EME87193.1 hypothetical protein MYCFIDRAFT_169052 [Pseudocercospora fijiensis CIRAD86]